MEGYVGDGVLLRICITPSIILRENIEFTTLRNKNILFNTNNFTMIALSISYERVIPLIREIKYKRANISEICTDIIR